jgi:DNA-binding Lrp family transcriptional regulator
MLPLEVLSMIIQGFIGFLLAYFAYDFLQEFKELRKSVVTLNISMSTVVDRLERIEKDHGHRIERLETELL